MRVTESILAHEDGGADTPPGHCYVWHGAERYGNVKAWRDWASIDTIVLHQTGVWMNDTPDRFERLKAHIGILRDHPTPIVQVAPLNAYMHHAGVLNAPSIGIEVNGLFEGIDQPTPADGYNRAPDAQLENVRRAIRWACHEVGDHGGQMRRILPHRVSSASRRSDPGERVWRECGLWAQTVLGLSDDGPGYRVADGRAIPYDWNGKECYERYRY
jgi:hypothetical protein